MGQKHKIVQIAAFPITFVTDFIVSAVEFEQVNVWWVPIYQFMNAEITCY